VRNQPADRDKEKIKAYHSARHEIGQFDNRAWLALSRLLGDHFPFTETEKIDLLMKVKIANSEYDEHNKQH